MACPAYTRSYYIHNIKTSASLPPRSNFISLNLLAKTLPYQFP
jgi:hypothetical protein